MFPFVLNVVLTAMLAIDAMTLASFFFFFFDNGMGISVKSVYMLNYIYLLMYLVLWCPYLVLV